MLRCAQRVKIYWRKRGPEWQALLHVPHRVPRLQAASAVAEAEAFEAAQRSSGGDSAPAAFAVSGQKRVEEMTEEEQIMHAMSMSQLDPEGWQVRLRGRGPMVGLAGVPPLSPV